MRKLVPHLDLVVMITISQKFLYRFVIYKSGDQHINKSTDNEFLIDYTDHLSHFVFNFPFMSYTYNYYIICWHYMLDDFNNLLCSKLCWYNRPGPSMAI